MIQLVLCFFVLGLHHSRGYLTTIWIKTANIGPLGTSNAQIVSYSRFLQNYDIDVTLNKYINFKVKANGDAAVFLLPSKTMTDEDEFYYGQFGAWGNTRNVIEYKANKYATWQGIDGSGAYIGYVLNFDEFKPFFVSWDNGTMRIGAGTVQNPEYQASADLQSFVVKEASVCTVWSSIGYWIIEIEAQFEGYYSACGTENTRGNMTLLLPMVNATKLVCALQCSTSQNCLGFNHNEVENLCEIISTDQLIEETSDVGWKFYRKCLNGRIKCQCF